MSKNSHHHSSERKATSYIYIMKSTPISKFAIAALIGHAVSALPTYIGQCDNWAKSGECLSNPSFMWTDCAAACTSLGLKEPWADADERALAGLPSSIAAQLLELRFAPSTGFAPLRILLRPDLAPLTVAAIRQHIVGAEGSNPAAVFYRSEAKPAAAPVLARGSGHTKCSGKPMIRAHSRGVRKRGPLS